MYLEPDHTILIRRFLHSDCVVPTRVFGGGGKRCIEIDTAGQIPSLLDARRARSTLKPPAGRRANEDERGEKPGQHSENSRVISRTSDRFGHDLLDTSTPLSKSAHPASTSSEAPGSREEMSRLPATPARSNTPWYHSNADLATFRVSAFAATQTSLGLPWIGLMFSEETESPDESST